MEFFHRIALAAALGATAGVVIGLLLAGFRRRRQDPESAAYQKTARFTRQLFARLSKGLYAVLGIGLIWTVYLLVVGLADRGQTEFATNASTLIVSVLTLFSILIAYYEFMHRGGKQ